MKAPILLAQARPLGLDSVWPGGPYLSLTGPCQPSRTQDVDAGAVACQWLGLGTQDWF